MLKKKAVTLYGRSFMVNRPNVNSDNVKLPKLSMGEFLCSFSPAQLLMQSLQTPHTPLCFCLSDQGDFLMFLLSFFCTK